MNQEILQIIANQIQHPTTMVDTSYHNCAHGKYISINPTSHHPIILYIEKTRPQEAFLSGRSGSMLLTDIKRRQPYHATHIPLADPQLFQKINEFIHRHPFCWADELTT